MFTQVHTRFVRVTMKKNELTRIKSKKKNLRKLRNELLGVFQQKRHFFKSLIFSKFTPRHMI